MSQDIATILALLVCFIHFFLIKSLIFSEFSIDLQLYILEAPVSSNKSDKSESVDLLISLIYEFMLLKSFKKKGTWYF